MALIDSKQWHLHSDRQGMRSYTCAVSGSAHQAVKVETLVEASCLSSLIAVLLDADACPEWLAHCESARIVEQVSDTESYVYSKTKMPFPIKDRDVVTHEKWHHDADTGEIHMQSSAVSGVLDPVKGCLRISFAEVYWLFQPLENGQLRIVNQAHIDPGTKLPSWLSNKLMIDGPRDMLSAMLQQAKKQKYQQTSISFLTE